MEGPAGQRDLKRSCLYSWSFYCAYGLHWLLLEECGVVLQRFIPGPHIRHRRLSPCPRPCLFTAIHQQQGEAVIMASHEWLFEDVINVEVCLLVTCVCGAVL